MPRGRPRKEPAPPATLKGDPGALTDEERAKIREVRQVQASRAKPMLDPGGVVMSPPVTLPEDSPAVSPTPPVPEETAPSSDTPTPVTLLREILQPRTFEALAARVGKEKEVVANAAMTKAPAVRVMEEMGYDPVRSLITLRQTGIRPYVLKDGTVMQLPLEPGDLIRIDAELAKYAYAQNKSVEGVSVKTQNNNTVVINWGVPDPRAGANKS